MIALLSVLGTSATYPTATASWVTPDVISKWPTDTDDWGPPPTEFFTDSEPRMGASAMAGIVIAAVAAVAVVILCAIVLFRRPERNDKKDDNPRTELTKQINPL